MNAKFKIQNAECKMKVSASQMFLIIFLSKVMPMRRSFDLLRSLSLSSAVIKFIFNSCRRHTTILHFAFCI